MKRRIPRSFGALALALFGTLLGLASLEVALRVYDATKPRPPASRGDFWEQRVGYGWLHPAGAQGEWFDDHGEYALSVRMNSRGLRDVEHPLGKEPGVFRILLLGDSYVEGMQVPLEEILARRLEAMLSREGRRVEVVNAGVADWGTDNELQFFREEGRLYRPDLVLLAFTTANDVRNNSPVLNAQVPNPNLYKPTFSLSADGQLSFHPMPAIPAAAPRPWWDGIRVATFFSNRIGFPRRPETLPSGTLAPAPAPSPTGRVFTDMLVYQSPPPPEVAEAWKVTQALVLGLRSEAEKEGAAFAMVLVNGPWAHVDDYWRLMLIADPVAQETWNRRLPNEVMAKFLAGQGIDGLDLVDAFEAAHDRGPLFFRRDPHWTSLGHRVAAEAVAKFLVQRELVPAVPD